MTTRLRVQEFMVLTTGGVPVFHYSVTGQRKLDELLSGFLSAITSFATELGEKSIQALAFGSSEILYEPAGNNHLSILLVDTGGPIRLLRAVLKDLSRKFVQMFAAQLNTDIQIEEIYLPFNDEVKRALAFYDRVHATLSGISPLAVPSVNLSALSFPDSSSNLLEAYHREFGSVGERLLENIDGRTTIRQLSQALGLEMSEIIEAIEYLAVWGVVQILKMCPIIRESDSRFDLYLDMVGIPSRDFQILSKARPLCNGNRSIEEISERIGVTAERLSEVLGRLGNMVRYNLINVIEMSSSPL